MEFFPNFRGVLFRDIGPLIRDPAAFKRCIDELVNRYQAGKNQGRKIDVVLVAEARGYMFGSPLAHLIGAGIVQARKKGKLPGDVLQCQYKTEYSQECFEVQEGRIRKGDNVLIVDDLLATSGTALAMADLAERSGGNVEEFAFIIELVNLRGREKLEGKGYKVFSIIKDSED